MDFSVLRSSTMKKPTHAERKALWRVRRETIIRMSKKLSLAEVGEANGISKQRVHQILQKEKARQ